MGIQIFIDMVDVPKNVTPFTEVDVDIIENEDGTETEYKCEYTTLTAEDGTKKTFHRIGDTLWIDANPWGSIRSHYIPWLQGHGIKYNEG